MDMSKPGSSFPSRIQSDAERPTLLLLDRSFDPLSPLLHEFTYQAMAYDLLPVHDDRYAYHFVGNNNKQQTRDVLLNDTDELWSRNRLMHIADLGKQINVDYKKFISDHPEAAKLAKKSDGKAKELKEMIAGLQNIPKFQATSALYSQHMAITGQLMTKYNQCGLEQIATLEQNMATGEDSAGKAFKAALPELKSLLQNSDLPLSPVDKMRLLMIYVITQDGIRQD